MSNIKGIRGAKNKHIIYFDNNGTTFTPKSVQNAMIKGTTYGNASTSYAKDGKKCLSDFKRKVMSRVGNKKSEIIITSGASESINLFLRSMAQLFPGKHFIISSIEHNTTIKCAESLKGKIKLSWVKPRADGCIHLLDIKSLIKNDTVAIVVMHINNETGAINDIAGIQKFCRKKGIFYLADTVQSFGKFKLPDLDACTVSFHKMYGPQGIGALIIDRRIISMGFPAQICGSQNQGLRGGTENLPGISGALEAMNITFRDRSRKNARLHKMKQRILNNLRKDFEEEDFKKYIGKNSQFRGFSHNWSFMLIGGEKTAPNVMLISFNKNRSDPHHFCNVELKKELLKRNIICSIGSACGTSKKNSSHVLHAMKAPFIVRCGVIRISLGDYNTLKECDDFCRNLVECIFKQN